MADIENVIDSLRYAKTNADGNIWIANSERDAMVRILTKTAELLKEQQQIKERILRNIVDNQLANAPSGQNELLVEHHKKGVWDGLQMAYEIVEHDGN